MHAGIQNWMRGKHVRLWVLQRSFPSTCLVRLITNSTPSSLTWLLGSSFIILITMQANIIHGLSHFGSYYDCYLITGSCQNHSNDAQTFEILKQTQRQASIKELKSADRAGDLPSSCPCWCAAWPWMLLWETCRPWEGSLWRSAQHVILITESKRVGIMRACNTEARLPIATLDENFLTGKLLL